MDDVASRREMPERCILAPESGDLGLEVHILFHGRKNRAYKIYFAIGREQSSMGLVTVFHVRHWARKQLPREDLEELMADEADS